MKVKIVSMEGEIKELEALKFKASTYDGNFEILDRHIDLVALIAPCVIEITLKNREVQFFACDEGALIKEKSFLSVAVRRVVMGSSAENLEQAVKNYLDSLSESERAARKALDELILKTGKGKANGI